MEVPLDWELGAFDGDNISGYLRLDTLINPRLEIRWKRCGKGSRIEQAAQSYLTSLTRTNKNHQRYRKPKPWNPNVAWPDNLHVRCYRWTGQSECAAAIIHCPTCRRISVVQISFPPDKFNSALSKRVLESLHEHNPDDVAYWDFYLLHLRTPSSWKLLAHKFSPGYAELNFVGPDKLQADFRRWGPASILLEDKDLQQWARENWPTKIKADSIETLNRHGELSQVARRNASGILAPLRRALGQGPGIRKALYWHSTSWHCPASERLWIVDIFARSGPQAAQKNWQVLCHQLPKI